MKAKASDKSKALAVLAGLGSSGEQRQEDGSTAEALEGLNGRPTQQLKTAEIEPDPDQPRREFNPQALERLAQSIREHGVLQPLVVRRVGKKVFIVAGERRWRAASLAALKTVPVIFKSDLPADQVLELQLIENLDRENLSDFEQTQAVVRLIALRLGLDVRAVKPLIGKMVTGTAVDQPDREVVDQAIRSLGVGLESFYKNKLPILEIASDLAAAINAGQLPSSSALILNRILDSRERQALTERVIRERLPRAQVSALVSQLLKRPSASKVSFKPRLSAIATWADRLEPKSRKELERLLGEIAKLKPAR